MSCVFHILVAKDEDPKFSVFFYSDQSGMTIIPLFTHVDQFEWFMPLLENVCDLIWACI